MLHVWCSRINRGVGMFAWVVIVFGIVLLMGSFFLVVVLRISFDIGFGIVF